jgi:hypothetical protein
MSVTKDGSFPVTAHDTAVGSGTTTWPAFTTPGTNRMVVAMLLGDGGATTAINSLTSPNLTWTNRVGVVDAGGNMRVEIWTAFAASVVTSEVISSTHTGSMNYSYRDLLIFSLAGSDASGVANPASVNNWNAAANPSLSITATGAGSYLVMGLPYRTDGGGVALVADGNSTLEFNEGGSGAFAFGGAAASRSSAGAGALTVGFTGTLLGGNSLGGIEIKIAAGGGGARGLFMTPPVSGLGVGGSFFRDPLQAPAQMVKRDRIFIPAWLAAAA